jgi:hypothetical protein
MQFSKVLDLFLWRGALEGSQGLDDYDQLQWIINLQAARLAHGTRQLGIDG